MATPYNTLKLKANATDHEIRTSFRTASLTHHPDKGGDSSHVRLARAAYKILIDPDSRFQWDNAIGYAYDNFQRTCVSEGVEIGPKVSIAVFEPDYRFEPKSYAPVNYELQPYEQEYRSREIVVLRVGQGVKSQKGKAKVAAGPAWAAIPQVETASVDGKISTATSKSRRDSGVSVWGTKK